MVSGDGPRWGRLRRRGIARASLRGQAGQRGNGAGRASRHQRALPGADRRRRSLRGHFGCRGDLPDWRRWHSGDRRSGVGQLGGLACARRRWQSVRLLVAGRRRLPYPRRRRRVAPLLHRPADHIRPCAPARRHAGGRHRASRATHPRRQRPKAGADLPAGLRSRNRDRGGRRRPVRSQLGALRAAHVRPPPGPVRHGRVGRARRRAGHTLGAADLGRRHP